MAKATGKVKDNRAIARALRMPAKLTDKRIQAVIISDPDELEALAAKDKSVNLQHLHDTGVILGDWKGVKVK